MKNRVMSASQGANWPTFNSIPKWYDAVCQSVGRALDITTPGQQRGKGFHTVGASRG